MGFSRPLVNGGSVFKGGNKIRHAWSVRPSDAGRRANHPHVRLPVRANFRTSIQTNSAQAGAGTASELTPWSIVSVVMSRLVPIVARGFCVLVVVLSAISSQALASGGTPVALHLTFRKVASHLSSWPAGSGRYVAYATLRTP